jgi:hypothetical protein
MIASLFLIFLSCSKDDDLMNPEEMDNPILMVVSCQASIDDTLRLVEYEYENDNLIKETIFQNGEIYSKTTFGYNLNNQIVSEIYLTDLRKSEKTFVYDESNKLINILYEIIQYDTDGQITNQSESEAPREYENNLLVIEWEYWGGFNTYEYNNGKIVTKIDYTKNGEKHHFTYYKYSGDLLIEEKKENKSGGLLYLKTYSYDSQNRMIQIKDTDNIIEENDYFGNKLVEKRTYYFGIDPGYDICYGNYVYRYKY